MNLYNVKDIKELLSRHGFRFSKGLGQNFLCREWVPKKIAEMCGADKETLVLEVGPGIGVLTRELCKAAARVVSVEIDKRLIPVLKETLGDCENIEIINQDILKCNIREIIGSSAHDNIIACANLPYYITTPAISALIEPHCFNSITVMVQKEVAQRICAKPGTHEYGAFTVYINYHCTPEILFDVPSGCFIPQPKVDSSVVKLTTRKTSAYDGIDEKKYFSIVRAAFCKRRKTLANAIDGIASQGFTKAEITDIIKSLGFSETVRGEQLSPDDFARLTFKLCGRF